MTAKEKLIRDVLDLDETNAARARIVVSDEREPEAETAPDGFAPLEGEDLLAPP